MKPVIWRWVLLGVILVAPTGFAQTDSASTGQPPAVTDANQAAVWETRAQAPGIADSERGRCYYNAATALLQAAVADPNAAGQKSATTPGRGADLNKILAFLQRAAALAPDLGVKIGRNWEIARAMQHQAESQKPQAKSSGQQGKSSGQQDKNSGQQDKNSAQQDIARLQQQQTALVGKPANSSSATSQSQVAKDTKALEKRVDKERTRQSLQAARQSMEAAAAALKQGDKDTAAKQQQQAMAALAEAQQAEQGNIPENQALRDLSQKEKEYRQLQALLRPVVPQQVEKNW